MTKTFYCSKHGVTVIISDNGRVIKPPEPGSRLTRYNTCALLVPLGDIKAGRLYSRDLSGLPTGQYCDIEER